MLSPTSQGQFDSLVQAFAGLANSQSDALSENLTKESVLRAQESVNMAESLREDLFKDIEELEQQTIKIRKKLVIHIHSENNPEGSLKKPLPAYERCISIDKEGIVNLLNQDVQFWQSALDQTQ